MKDYEDDNSQGRGVHTTFTEMEEIYVKIKTQKIIAIKKLKHGLGKVCTRAYKAMAIHFRMTNMGKCEVCKYLLAKVL